MIGGGPWQHPSRGVPRVDKRRREEVEAEREWYVDRTREAGKKVETRSKS